MRKSNEIKDTHTLLKEECQELLKEGILPDYTKKTVKLTMDNNDNVNLSEGNYIKFRANGLTVYTIFSNTTLPDYCRFNKQVQIYIIFS